jgi:CheY-like chemotaxis protein
MVDDNSGPLMVPYELACIREKASRLLASDLDPKLSAYIELIIECSDRALKNMSGGQSSAAKAVVSAPEVPTAPEEDKIAARQVLVVEDNFANQLVVSEILKKIFCEPHVVDSGEEGLEILKNNPDKFNLIIMDCQMPGMDGYETTQAIRKLDNAAANLPIIALTADAMQGTRERCLNSGMNEYLTKPVVLNQLKKIIDLFV